MRKAEEACLASCRVLVADDNKVNRSVVSRMLAGAGAQVVFASNGEEALSILSEGDLSLALLDINMPILDGIEVAQLYRFAVSEDERIPLVALTADGSAEIQARCAEAGMAMCLVKPLRTAALLAAVQSVLAISEVDPAQAGDDAVEGSERLDVRTFSELERLGGPEFLEELISDFRRDCQASVSSISTAVTGGDLQRFRFEAHSISSAAANLGARALHEICSPLGRVSEYVFWMDRAKLLTQVQREWNMTCYELDRRSVASVIPGWSGDSRRLTN